MHKPFNKILLLIVVILLLPLVSFFIYQFSQISENEKQVQQIYKSQLETILFSINQYSEDIVSSWANELTEIEDNPKIRAADFLSSNSSINGIFYFNLQNQELFIHSNNDDKIISDKLKSLLNTNQKKINKLISYLENNYRKIESIGKIKQFNNDIIVFAIKNKIGEVRIGGMLINPNEFIKNNLVSKIAQACGDKFILAALDETNKQIIHSCKKVSYDELKVKKSFWILPGYALGISMSDGNIEDVVKKRYYENLIIMILLLFVLLVGIIFLYRNIKNEMRIMQIKSDFISNVSHELRTPLSLISMYSETLSMDRLKDDDKKREYYNVIHSEANRLSKLVNSILNFSKMESGKRKFNFSEVNLVKINNEVLETHKQKIKSSSFDIKLDIKSERTTLFGDGEAITEAMINLLDNAIKYSGSSKLIEIKIGENDEGHYWSITDYGIGFDMKEKNKIFEKFYRVSTGLIHNVKGTGLGLSLVKQIMIAHKGDVTVKSVLGSGSTFTLQFNKNFKSN